MHAKDATIGCTTPGKDCRGSGLRGQFARPTGVVGTLVGHVMALKNRRRSEWVVAMLDLRRDERVLEVGFGPGTDIRRAAERAAFVAGVDVSEVMVRQALRRNAVAVRAGRVDLRLGAADALPFADASFDKAFSINSAQFWPDQLAAMRAIRRVLRPGGRAAIAVQPRDPGATEETATQTGRDLLYWMEAAGFCDVRLERKLLPPISVVCAHGVK